MVLLGLGLAGCAQQYPAAGSRLPPARPLGISHYRLALGASVIQPVPLQQPVPVYPVDALHSAQGSVELAVELTVNAAGSVEQIQFSAPDTTNPARQAFITAVRTAVLQWHFSPRVMNYLAMDAEGNSHLVDQQQLPFKQAYLFHFEIKNGIGLSQIRSL